MKELLKILHNILITTSVFILLSTSLYIIKSRIYSTLLMSNETQVILDRQLEECKSDTDALLKIIKNNEEELSNQNSEIKQLEKEILELKKQVNVKPTKTEIVKMDCNVAWYLKNKYGTQNKFFEPYLKKNAPKEVYNAIFNCK